MNDQSLSLLALDRAAAALTEAATDLTLAAALARSVGLAHDASVLARVRPRGRRWMHGEYRAAQMGVRVVQGIQRVGGSTQARVQR